MKKLLILTLAVVGLGLVSSHSTLAKLSQPAANQNVQAEPNCGNNLDHNTSYESASTVQEGILMASEATALSGCNSRCTKVYCQDGHGGTYLCRCDCPKTNVGETTPKKL